MTDKILLNNQIYNISEDKLPCLIIYAENVGGSYFSVTMAADLFLRGKKILFLSAYPMAKDNFLEQVKGNEDKISYITNINQLKSDSQGIIVESGNGNLFLDIVKKLDDIQERVIFIKNIEVFNVVVFNSYLQLRNIILSGDIDRCSFKEKINEKEFKTIIVFAKPKIKLPIIVPELDRYVGYLKSELEEGLVRISG